jgi:hypothetical protein
MLLFNSSQGAKRANEVYVNQDFVVSIIAAEFFFDVKLDTDVKINFLEDLRYFFKFRHYTAQNIELMLTAFNVASGKNPNKGVKSDVQF